MSESDPFAPKTVREQAQEAQGHADEAQARADRLKDHADQIESKGEKTPVNGSSSAPKVVADEEIEENDEEEVVEPDESEVPVKPKTKPRKKA